MGGDPPAPLGRSADVRQPIHEAIFRSQPVEESRVVSNITGALPHDLNGTLLRTGPGLLELGDDTLNFFDGHALIAGASFHEGKLTFRSRFVRTPLYEQETRAGRMLQRRVFTNLPARWSNLFALTAGNSAMHDVYTWGQGELSRVIAGFDLGHFSLDPWTLDTLGPERWRGAVPHGCEMAPMPYADPASGRLIAWLKRVGVARPDALSFVELSADFSVAKQTPFHALGTSNAFIHDQRATARWYVATEQAPRLSPARAIWGKSTLYDAFEVPAGGSATLLLVSRDDGRRSVRLPIGRGVEIAFHVINAFDEGEHVVVDLCTYDGAIAFGAAASARHRERTGVTRLRSAQPVPLRLVVDPMAGEIVEARRLSSLHFEAPEVSDRVMGSRYRFAYAPTPGPATTELPDPGGYFYFSALAKLDVESGEAKVWAAGDATIVSPPAFVPRPGAQAEDDGWLIAYVLEESGASVVVLDAQNVEAGPLAKAKVSEHLPGVSHTRWAAGLRLSV